MKLFIDSGAFIALHSQTDAHYDEAVEKFKKILDGEIPVTRMYTSDYIISEAITVALARTSHKSAVELGDAIVNSKSLEKLNVDEETFESAWRIFKKYTDKNFSFVDCTAFALMWRWGIKHVFSFDKHFDEVGFIRI